MMILKKKEIIAASLVLLIGMAGYLNWSYQDTVRVKDGDSYIATGKTLGEAELVSANNEVTEEDKEDTSEAASEDAASEQQPEQEEAADAAESTGYFEDAKMNRESARAAALETLKATAADESVDEKTRALAGEKLVESAANIETESRIESVAQAKGFSEICAYVNEGTVTLTVRSSGMSAEDAEKLRDIVTSSSDISADRVKIVEVK